jgi:hypothetical protein
MAKNRYLKYKKYNKDEDIEYDDIDYTDDLDDYNKKINTDPNKKKYKEDEEN